MFLLLAVGIIQQDCACGLFSQLLSKNCCISFLHPAVCVIQQDFKCVCGCQLSISSRKDLYVSGSTGVFGVLQDRKLLVGNVGDSRAVLGRSNKAGIVKALELSSDQKPNR